MGNSKIFWTIFDFCLAQKSAKPDTSSDFLAKKNGEIYENLRPALGLCPFLLPKAHGERDVQAVAPRNPWKPGREHPALAGDPPALKRLGRAATWFGIREDSQRGNGRLNSSTNDHFPKTKINVHHPFMIIIIHYDEFRFGSSSKTSTNVINLGLDLWDFGIHRLNLSQPAALPRPSKVVGPHEVLNALHAKCNAKPMAMDLFLGGVMRLCFC